MNKKNQSNNKVVSLFCTPLMVYGENRKFKNSELEHIISLEQNKKKNQSNYRSKSNKVLNSPELAALREYIQNGVNYYAHQFLDISANSVQFYITQSWCNFNMPGESHHLHHHPNSLISGIFYIQGTQAPIQFHRHDRLFPLDFNYESNNLYNGDIVSLNLIPGRLYLFPSLLRHSVKENSSDTTRISLSFNTFARGQFGRPNELDSLQL